MPKSRLSGDGGNSRRTADLNIHRFIGISLAGGKTDKACVVVLEYYPKHAKVFLTKIHEKIKSDEKISGDAKIFELVEQYHGQVDFIALDMPWQLPQCLRCSLKCPGFEACDEPHIQWMWRHFEKHSKKKKPKRLFTPYTQRCVEMFLSTEMEEVFTPHHAMGANSAPLLARAHFIQRRFHLPTIEVNPKVSLWRLGRSLGVLKRHLRFHRHAVGGDESRRAILKALAERNVAFVYEQDVKVMIENNHAFEAFLCALTGFLKFKGKTEARPPQFPEHEDWIEIPI